MFWGDASPNGIYSNFLALGLGENISKIMIYVFGAISFIFFFICKDGHKRLFILNFIMVMCPMWSGAYTPAFFVIPFLYLMSKTEYIKNKVDFIYILLYSVLYTSSCFTFKFSSEKIFIAAMILFAVIIIDEFANLKRSKAKKVIDIQ